MLGVGIIAAGVVGVLLWAAFAPLEGAATAHGLVVRDGYKKTIQHLDGGIIRAILVRDGQIVSAGQVLIEMDPTQPDAAHAITSSNFFSLKAQEARLRAEQTGSPLLTFPPELLARRGEPVAAQAMRDEAALFVERTSSVNGQILLFEAQRDQSRSEIRGIIAQRQALERQLALIRSELTDLRDAYDQGFVPRPRILALGREEANLSGSAGRLDAEKAQVEQNIVETELKITHLRRVFSSGASEKLAIVRVQLSEAEERNSVAEKAADRIKIRAPVAGVVQNLHYVTEGGVLRGGEPIMDIAPSEGVMIIRAQFEPQNVEYVQPGMVTEVRLPAFHSRRIPVLNGHILTISRDRLTDAEGKHPYYLGQVSIDAHQLPHEVARKVTAGMPAEVVVPTGARTPFDYWLQPLRFKMRTTMREE